MVTGVLIYAALLVPAVLVALIVMVWRLWHRQKQVDAFMRATTECVDATVTLVAMLAYTNLDREVDWDAPEGK